MWLMYAVDLDVDLMRLGGRSLMALPLGYTYLGGPTMFLLLWNFPYLLVIRDL